MLAARLRQRIEASGPISFSEFMEAALYDPDDGFYAGTPVGEAGHFVTSPHTSPMFGELLATQLQEIRALLGRPDRFTIVEAGAGDGTLGRHIGRALPASDLAETEYVFIERGTSARRALDELTHGLGGRSRVVADIGMLDAGSVEGCILANELLDNFPFRRARRTAEGLVEQMVALGSPAGAGGEPPFVLLDGPLIQPAPDQRAGRPAAEGEAAMLNEIERAASPGQECIVPTGALEFVERAIRVLRRGYLLLIDYAAPDPEDTLEETAASPGSFAVHGYRRHHVVADVLADPGSRDITAGVDFGILARRASALGLSVWGPVLQRNALRALGYGDAMVALRDRQVEALDSGRGVEAARRYSDRNRAGLLVDPGGLGGFQILCLGVGVDTPPRCVRPQ
jgi:SAM-dependent MidA family methyltransferase